jgi:tRNA(Ile)-lysidine synthase
MERPGDDFCLSGATPAGQSVRVLQDQIEWLSTASKRRRYLVGVSGGADSVALLHLLHRAGFANLIVCHLNHGLRGRAAAADARFVARLAERLGHAFELGREDVGQSARRGTCSIETAGRRARHAFFAECARKWRCRRLLLAHHADDQVETVLWNLLRGSRGASGMKPGQTLAMGGRTIEVSRPLLEISRAQLRAWLEVEKLKWREDASNAEPMAIRNRLRNEALPLLEQIAGRDAVAALQKAAESDAELREIEAWAVEQAAVLDPQGRIHIKQLRSLPRALQRSCVFEYLRHHQVRDLDRGTIGRVLGMLEAGGPSSLDLPGGARMRRRQGRLSIG